MLRPHSFSKYLQRTWYLPSTELDDKNTRITKNASMVFAVLSLQTQKEVIIAECGR